MQVGRLLPKMLAWHLNLPLVDVTEGSNTVSAFIEDTNMIPINVQACILDIGHSEAMAGASIHFPAKSLQGDRTYSRAYSPAIRLEFWTDEGSSIQFAMTAEIAKKLADSLRIEADKIAEYETTRGEDKLVMLCKQLKEIEVGYKDEVE